LGQNRQFVSSSASPPRGRFLAVLTLGALGIVYGDIGTSPLYALRESFHASHGILPTGDNVLGILSLIFWTLNLLISIKYLIFVMRADNKGEGGVLTLIALVSQHPDARRRSRTILIALGLFGAALLYGDGMLTPAISVLSAVEGLKLATPALEPYVLPITIAILLGIFMIQSRGTGTVGALFGPIMIVWFVTIALLAVPWIIREPHVFAALDPRFAVKFFLANGAAAYVALGSVFLVVTGGEALYADMGHFGPKPIRLAWFTLVLPSLMLNYLGQGAMLLSVDDPRKAADAPFFLMAPPWLLIPIVVLAALAAIIASQALISGAFSLTRQAVQLGYCPRMTIEHTSARQHGQIYIPQVNWALMIATIGLVLGFRSSSGLANAYGIAVGATMIITTLLTYLVARGSWGVGRLTAGSLAAIFLAIEIALFGANLHKIPHGGWFTLAVAALVFVMLSTWKAGRALLGKRLAERMYPFERFLQDIAAAPPHRVSGTAVFMTSNKAGTPPTLLHNLQHNKVLHERVILLTVVTADTPDVEPDERLTVEHVGHNFFRYILRYGFMEEPDIPTALTLEAGPTVRIDMEDTTFFLGIETLLATRREGMPLWRERLFALMSRNALRATSFFKIPPERVVEIGMQVEL
jgi:KUP system potassium uptake protein